jgi:hypothetical protein
MGWIVPIGLHAVPYESPVPARRLSTLGSTPKTLTIRLGKPVISVSRYCRKRRRNSARDSTSQAKLRLSHPQLIRAEVLPRKEPRPKSRLLFPLCLPLPYGRSHRLVHFCTPRALSVVSEVVKWCVPDASAFVVFSVLDP